MLDPASAGVCSLFLPGTGQLLTGRPGRAVYFGLLALFTWAVSFGLFGWVIHLCAALDAWHRAQPVFSPPLVGAESGSRPSVEAPRCEGSNVIPFPHPHHPDAH